MIVQFTEQIIAKLFSIWRWSNLVITRRGNETWFEMMPDRIFERLDFA